jgi:hypothetical protein
LSVIQEILRLAEEEPTNEEGFYPLDFNYGWVAQYNNVSPPSVTTVFNNDVYPTEASASSVLFNLQEVYDDLRDY